jgi:hypothetical protein
MIAVISGSAAWGEETKLKTIPPACPTCCEVTKPFPGISADDLMRINIDIKFTKFAKDYKGIGFVKLINKKGFTRTRDWGRYRILLGKRSDVFDYKDFVVILGPQNLKGLSVLTWVYLDPGKDHDVWLWLPSLRKVRRISQSEEDDPFMGSEFTTEEISTRRWEDETYKMIGEKKFNGYTAKFDGKTYYKDADCYVIEATPKRKDWYYSKRIIWLDKQFAGLIFDEVYDPAGRKWKTFLKYYATWDDGCIPQILLEGNDLLTGHLTDIGFKEEDIKFNTNQKEGFFTERTLMRSKW